jgi:hypothetical protein
MLFQLQTRIQCCVSANYEFVMVDIGANGRVSDGGVSANTKFFKRLTEGTLQIPHSQNLPQSNELMRLFAGDFVSRKKCNEDHRGDTG